MVSRAQQRYVGMMTSRRAFSVSTFARFEGKVLLIHHRRLGTWLPVGGEVEAGETPLEAARRELKEETGLQGDFVALAGAIDGAPPGLLGYEEHHAGSKGLHMNFAFVADVKTDAVVPSEEITEHRWISSTASLSCPENVHQLARMALHSAGAPLEGIARAWLARFNARDVEGILELYAQDAVHTSPKLRVRRPETSGEIRGKEAMRRWWADSFERLPAMRYEEQHLTASKGRVFMEYLRLCPPEPPMLVAEVLVCEGGLIVESRVFHG